VSLTTPTAIRTLQRKLYVAAKAQPDRRFHQLYDKVYREDILEHAYRLARQAGGAPGVDGESFEAIEAQGEGEWLARLGEELRGQRYRPQAVRRVMIPKPGGGERPLGIPTIRDRVVQGAARLVLEPIFEADFTDCAYGYRPKRAAPNFRNSCGRWRPLRHFATPQMMASMRGAYVVTETYAIVDRAGRNSQGR
jgi:RNA-directed DNA polymerase